MADALIDNAEKYVGLLFFLNVFIQIKRAIFFFKYVDV